MKAIVTGASSGIGKEIAAYLAKCGYNLILVARREERLNKIAAVLKRKYNVNVTVEAVDLADEEETEALAQRCMGESVDILVNNAGFGKLGFFEDVPLSEELEMIRTNLVAVHILMKRFIQSQKSGYILNVSSIAGFQPGPAFSTYSATKAYLLSLGQAVGYELKKKHVPISVTTVCPGPVRTEFDKVAGTDFALHQMPAGKCARAAVDAMFAGKDVAFCDMQTRVLHKLVKITPQKLLLPINYFIQTSKKGEKYRKE